MLVIIFLAPAAPGVKRFAGTIDTMRESAVQKALTKEGIKRCAEFNSM